MLALRLVSCVVRHFLMSFFTALSLSVFSFVESSITLTINLVMNTGLKGRGEIHPPPLPAVFIRAGNGILYVFLFLNPSPRVVRFSRAGL